MVAISTHTITFNFGSKNGCMSNANQFRMMHFVHNSTGFVSVLKQRKICQILELFDFSACFRISFPIQMFSSPSRFPFSACPFPSSKNACCSRAFSPFLPRASSGHTICPVIAPVSASPPRLATFPSTTFATTSPRHLVTGSSFLGAQRRRSHAPPPTRRKHCTLTTAPTAFSRL